MSGFFRSRWVERPVHAAEIAPTELPAGFRAAGVAAGIKQDGLDVGVLVSDHPDTVSAARFTTNARVGAPVTVSRAADLAGLRALVANSGCSNVGDGQRGLDTALAMQAKVAAKLGLQEAPGGRGLDRRDRHRAAARAGAGRRARRPATRWAPTPPTSPRRSSPATAVPSAPAWRCTCLGRRRAALGPGQGGGHDRAALRHDVLLRADRRRPGAGDARAAHRRVRQALVRPHLGRRPALHQRHGLRAGQRRLGRARGARVAGRAAPGRGAGRAAAPAGARDRGRRGGRRARGPDRGAAGARTPSSRWRARWPTRRWSRRRCTAATRTSAAFSRPPARPGRRASRSWPTWRSRGARWCRPGDVLEADARRARGAVAGGGVRADPARRGRRDRGVLQRPLGPAYVRFNSAYTS